MLGRDVCLAAERHEVIALSHGELDITDRAAVESAVSRARCDVVINCAAWTDVDGAERSPDGALAANADGAGNVACAAAAAGAHVIHLSSDYVFDGRKREPYVESDPVAPLSAYGRSKLAGERAVVDLAPESHTIVRSAWLFGTSGRSFPTTIMDLAREREQLQVVDDQVGSPTFTGHLSVALIDLAERRVPGTVHVAGTGSCSWFELAAEVVARAGIQCEIVPTTTSNMPRPATRPPFSALESERTADVPRLAHWREGVAEFTSLVVAAR
jgi:dTDP-4-dehydrorhamnose reductase